MNALTTLTIERLPALMDADMDAADEYLRAEKAASTRRAYGSDWTIFQAYCLARGVVAIPASSGTICAFLSAEARGGAKEASRTHLRR